MVTQTASTTEHTEIIEELKLPNPGVADGLLFILLTIRPVIRRLAATFELSGATFCRLGVDTCLVAILVSGLRRLHEEFCDDERES